MNKISTLLIIDDDEDDKEMPIEAVLEIDKTITCLKSCNGYEGLQLLATSNIIPDYIFLDLNMPRMNGKQFLLQIKHIDHLSQIPVVIYTTSKLPEDKDETERLGAAHYIIKPSSMNVLRKELKFLFE